MNIHIYKSDDWIAIYKDGRKVIEDHYTIHPHLLLRALGVEFSERMG